MSQENVHAVKRMDALFQSGDLAAALDYCDPDVEWRDLSAEGGAAERLRGVADLHSMLAAVWEFANSPFAVTDERREYIDAGDCVVTVTDSKSLGFDIHHATLQEFKDGKVVRITQGYADKGAALEAAGIASE